MILGSCQWREKSSKLFETWPRVENPEVSRCKARILCFFNLALKKLEILEWKFVCVNLTTLSASCVHDEFAVLLSQFTRLKFKIS